MIEDRYKDILSRAREAPHHELPALLAALAAEQAGLAAAQAVVASRLAQGRPTHDPGGTTRPQPERWLTPTEAATLAQVPVKTLYGWAKGRRWASRPTRRCLRVEEGAFRAWLQARR